jgi:hypothetical protein
MQPADDDKPQLVRGIMQSLLRLGWRSLLFGSTVSLFR